MLFCGSYSFLKEKLKETIKKIEKGQKLTFIVHTNQMKTFLKEYLTKELGILFNAEFYTLIDISKKLTNIEPLQDFDKELILKKFVYEKGLRLDGLPEQLSLIIQQIKEFEIDFNKSKGSVIIDILENYKKFLNDNGYYDREDLHNLASKSEIYPFKNVFIFGIKSVPPLHKRIYEKIKENADRFYIFFPVFTDSGVYQNYPNIQEILRFWEKLAGYKCEEENNENDNVKLIKEIFKFNYDNPDLKSLNIRIEKLNNEYEEVEYLAQNISNLLIEGVKLHKIGVILPDIKKYLPFLKEILKKYKIPYYLVEESRYIDDNLFKKLFYIFKIKEKRFNKESVLNILSDELLDIEDIQEIEEKIILYPAYEGFEEWKDFSLKENKFYKLLEYLNNIPEKADIQEYINRFRKIGNEFIKNQKIKIFLENILDRLEKTTIYKNLFKEVDYPEFVSIIEQLFKEENKENKIKGDTIFILTPTSAEGNNFDYIFFLNLNSGDYPSNLNEDIFLSIDEINNLDYPFHILMQEILSFINILDERKNITLSFIASSIFSGEKAPSIIIDEIKRIVNKDIINLRKVEYNGSLKDFKIKYAKYLKDIDENLQKKWERLEKNKNLTKNDFKITISENIFPISATDFSVYATCPYKFFIEKILKIETLDEPDRKELSALEKGIFIHKLLMEFYKDLSEDNITNKLEDLKKRYKEELEKILEYIIPSYRIFIKNEALNLLNNIIDFINQDLKALKENGKRPFELEKEYQNEYFKCRIDRIDKDEENNLYIYDYKVSKEPDKFEEKLKYRYIQLPVYKKVLEEQNKKIKEIGIIALNDENKKFLYSIKDEDKFSELNQIIEGLISELKENIFYPIKRNDCGYCNYTEFCLKDNLKEED